MVVLRIFFRVCAVDVLLNNEVFSRTAWIPWIFQPLIWAHIIFLFQGCSHIKISLKFVAHVVLVQLEHDKFLSNVCQCKGIWVAWGEATRSTADNQKKKKMQVILKLAWPHLFYYSCSLIRYSGYTAVCIVYWHRSWL